MHSNFDFKTSNFCLFATYIKITKKFIKKFDSKVINRQCFHRKTGLNSHLTTNGWFHNQSTRVALEIKKMKGRKDRNWVIFVGGSDMGPQGTKITWGKLGSKQKTQRGFMYPLNIAMGMDVYTFEEERKGFEIEERGTKCTEMYSQ